MILQLRISSSDGTPFTLEKPTRDLARGVGLLLVIDRQWKKREMRDVG